MKYAYEIDNYLAQIPQHANADDFVDGTLKSKVNRFKKLISPVNPRKEMNDEIWAFWLPMPVGSFQEYLSWIETEEAVEDAEIIDDLRVEWESEYPEKMKWYRLSFVSNKKLGDFHISFNAYFLMVKKAGDLCGYPFLDVKGQQQLLDFLYDKLRDIIDAIVKDPNAYAKSMERILSKRCRFGRINRLNYWQAINNDKGRIDQVLGDKRIRKLTQILPEISEGKILTSMTAGDFFRYCAIGYDANKYPQLNKKNLSPVEKYRAMADMRDEGLTTIDPLSEKAFREWYHTKRGGGHPWEICRGGNSTHISLYVTSADQHWKLILDGSSYGRVVETVKIALALYEHGVVVQLNRAEEILRMVTGEDYIGIVPQEMTPRYCHSYFPEEDRIIDFLNPWWMEPEEYKKIESHIYWYPLDKKSP